MKMLENLFPREMRHLTVRLLGPPLDTLSILNPSLWQRKVVLIIKLYSSKQRQHLTSVWDRCNLLSILLILIRNLRVVAVVILISITCDINETFD